MKSIRSSKTTVAAATALSLSAFLVGGTVFSPVVPAFADAVRVEAPQAPSFADVVEAVSPAVVSVRVKAAVQPATSRGFGAFEFDGLPKDHPLRRFFERGPRGESPFGRRDRPRRFGSSQGSGFFVSEDGYIVTNNHVVENGSKFTIITDDGSELDAKLIGADPKTDLAVLKVDEKRKFTYVSFSEKVSRVGEWVVAVGNPFGLGGTVTAGIISASGRDIGSGPYDDYVQIDAAVNKGNSGGPAFNLNGEVIGVNTAIFSPSGGNVGIAFAISARSASEVVDDLIKNGSVSRGWLGVQIQPVTKDIADSLGLEDAQGAIVSEAQKSSPASKAGIRSGDVIASVDGKPVKTPKELARAIASFEPESTVKIEVLRNGKREVVDVELGTLPGAPKRAALNQQGEADAEPVDLNELGIAVVKSRGSVIVADVNPNGPAAEKGVRSGDVVVSINGRDVNSVNEVGQALTSAIENNRKAVLFQLKSRNRNRFVALPLKQG